MAIRAAEATDLYEIVSWMHHRTDEELQTARTQGMTRYRIPFGSGFRLTHFNRWDELRRDLCEEIQNRPINRAFDDVQAMVEGRHPVIGLEDFAPGNEPENEPEPKLEAAVS